MNLPKEESSLINAIGQAKLHAVESSTIISNKHLKDCKNCGSLGAVIASYANSYLILKCPKCQKEWGVCTECDRQRTPLYTLKQLTVHTNNVHKKKKAQQKKQDDEVAPSPSVSYTRNPLSMDDDDNHLYPMSDDDTIESPAMKRSRADTIIIGLEDIKNGSNLGFNNKASEAYFHQCFLQGPNGGIEYIVKNSLLGSKLLPQDYKDMPLPDGHALLQMKIAHLTFLLTRNENEMLAEVMKGSYRVGLEDGYAFLQKNIRESLFHQTSVSITKLQELVYRTFNHNDIIQSAYESSIKVPRSWTEIRSYHTEGANAVIPNLPVPTVHTDVPGHAYVSLIDCIRHFLGHRDLTDVAFIAPDFHTQQEIVTEVSHCSNSPRAAEIASQSSYEPGDNQFLHGYIMIWSDDVEPNRTKSNRGSIWLLTATIGTPQELSHSMAHTYPIAVGKKNTDHGPIVLNLERDLNILRLGKAKPFYIGKRQQTARIKFEMFAAVQDQPERRDFNSMRAGNGTHSARFGVSADHISIYNHGKLASCTNCIKLMEHRLQHHDFTSALPTCNVCLNWDVLEDPNYLALYDPPKNYPRDERYLSDPCCRLIKRKEGLQLRPFKITYPSLKRAIDYAHDSFCNHGWSHAQCVSYLQVEGLDDKYIDHILEHSSRCLSLAIAKQQPAKYADLLEHARQRPHLYQKGKYCAAWERSTIQLHLHPDVIMHLLFLGVVKTIIQRIQSWLAAQLKLSSFIRSTEGYLDPFQAMTIDWLPILPYNAGKLGGWVSENLLAFSRLMPWFYQNIDTATKVRDEHEPPVHIPQRYWTTKQNRYWLQVRGLSTEGRKDDLSKRVADYLSQPDPPEAPLEEDLPPSQVQKTIIALWRVLKCVMSLKVTEELIHQTEISVKLFLSVYDELCKPLKLSSPPVLSSYNFICLLNLPAAMALFGPLRCIWEGGPMGEGFARFAKPYMTTGVLQQNWASNLLIRLLRAKTFDLLLKPPLPRTCPPNSTNALRERKGSFHKYDSEFTFINSVSGNDIRSKKKPVSVVLVRLQDTEIRIYGVVGDYDSIMRLTILEVEPESKFGLDYFKFKLTDQKSLKWADICSNVDLIGYGILLPLLQNNNEVMRYALISSNWEALEKNSNNLSKLL